MKPSAVDTTIPPGPPPAIALPTAPQSAAMTIRTTSSGSVNVMAFLADVRRSEKPGTLPPEWISALNDVEQHDDDCKHDEDVDEASHRVGRDHSKRPQHEQDDNESREHGGFLSVRKDRAGP